MSLHNMREYVANHFAALVGKFKHLLNGQGAAIVAVSGSITNQDQSIAITMFLKTTQVGFT